MLIDNSHLHSVCSAAILAVNPNASPVASATPLFLNMGIAAKLEDGSEWWVPSDGSDTPARQYTAEEIAWRVNAHQSFYDSVQADMGLPAPSSD